MLMRGFHFVELAKLGTKGSHICSIAGRKAFGPGEEEEIGQLGESWRGVLGCEWHVRRRGRGTWEGQSKLDCVQHIEIR
jgi:hypothetical protein